MSGTARAKRQPVMRAQGTPRARGRVDPHRSSGQSGEHEAPQPSLPQHPGPRSMSGAVGETGGKHHLYVK